MALKQYKPNTPGQRGLVLVDKSDLYKGKPIKKLTQGLNKSGGRNHSGKITMWQRGGGHKRRYRLIDFKRNKFDAYGAVERIEYDPNRSAYIALIKYEDEELRYIIAPQGLKVGDVVLSSIENEVPYKTGNCTILKNIPDGVSVHNIELKPGKGAQMARSAGTYARIMAKENNMITLKLPSGEMRMVMDSCLATVGVVGNSSHENIKIGNITANAWLKGITIVIKGTEISDIDPPKPDLAIPYNIIAGTTVKRKSKFNSIS